MDSATPAQRLGTLPPTRSRADQLADLLGERIESEALGPGVSLGTIDELRAECGFARATVSEAVRMLRDRGIVEIRPGRGGGLFVAERTPVVLLRRTLLRVQDHPARVRDAIELRDQLEPLIDVSAARHRTANDVCDLRALLDVMRLAATRSDFMEANWALHRRIATMCPNHMARAVYLGTLGHLAVPTSSVVADDCDAETAYQRGRYRLHRSLVEAVAAGDEPAVLAAVARHQLPT